MSGATSDRELVQALAARDSQRALVEIAGRYGQMVFATCLRVLGDRHAAEDAAQATFLILIRKGRRLGRDVNLAGWLHLTARLAAMDVRKTRARRARREREAAEMRSTVKREFPDAARPHLDAAIASLPRRQREVVVLRYLSGRSEAETAGELGCSRSSVSAALSRALGRLRERLARRGVIASAGALTGLMGAEAAVEMPAALGASLEALCLGKGVASTAATAAAQGVGKAAVLAKLKIAAVVLGASAAVGGGGTVAARRLIGPAAPLAAAPVRAGARPVVPLVSAKPELDGKVDEAVWKKALEVKLDGYCDNARRKKGQKPKDATVARLCTDKENLYVAFECAESHAEGPWVFEEAKYKRRGNSHVMGGDYVAVALDLGRWGLHNYYMFLVNAKGDVYRCFTWPHRYDLILRSIGLPAASAGARIDKAGKRWTVELKVPLAQMVRYPKDGFPRTAGVDLRRVQWGAERGKHKFSVYWTGMANVVGNRIKPQYDHMVSWKPLFETYPNYRNTYACGRGWVQLTFPESFGHLDFEVGKAESKLVVGQGKRLSGLIGTRTGWHKPKEMRAAAAKAFDAPRMESWEDLRPLKSPEGKARIISTPPVRKAGEAVSFATKPKIEETAAGVRISFKASARCDALVAVLDADGKVVRHLASGVLGPNPPEPFTKDSLSQTVVWDRKDDFGRAVKAGGYRVRVCLGLKPAFDYDIPIKKDWNSEDKTPTAKGLDVDNLPAAKIGRTLGHFSRGTLNYLSLDRDREELYVQTRQVYDGKTGKKLRDLKLEGPRVFHLKHNGNGEIFVSRRDGLLYAGGPNELWRFTREGKPAPFEAVGRHFIPELWGAHSNPHRGLCAGLDGDLYKVHHYIPHTSTANQVTRIAPDGRIKDYGFIRIATLAAGVRVDRRGNVYVGCTAQPPDALPPKELAARMPERPRKLFKNVYGSIVKFGPKGGAVRPDPAGDLVCPDYRSRLKKFSARGAQWVHPGFSPMLSRVSDDSGGPGCSCRNARFDLDDFERLFVPDAVSGRIEVTDSNANTILFIGGRGEAGKKAGVEFGWPTMVVASDSACYIADYLRYRITRVKLEYAAREEAAVTVR